jgi:hypothetical protein
LTGRTPASARRQVRPTSAGEGCGIRGEHQPRPAAITSSCRHRPLPCVLLPHAALARYTLRCLGPTKRTARSLRPRRPRPQRFWPHHPLPLHRCNPRRSLFPPPTQDGEMVIRGTDIAIAPHPVPIAMVPSPCVCKREVAILRVL